MRHCSQQGQHLFLVGEGRASVLVNEDREGRELLHIVGTVGQWWPDLKITIRDLTFVGNHESGDALVVEFPNDTLIDGCFFYGHGGKAVYLKTHGTNVTCRDCWMGDCRDMVISSNYFRSGCAIRLEGKCNGFAITGNLFGDVGDGAVVVAEAEGSGGHAITGNVIRKSVYQGRGDVRLGDSQGCSVVGNVFEEAATPAISAGPGGGCHLVSSNNITKSDGPAIVVGRAPDCVVIGNRVPPNPE